MSRIIRSLILPILGIIAMGRCYAQPLTMDIYFSINAYKLQGLDHDMNLTWDGSSFQTSIYFVPNNQTIFNPITQSYEIQNIWQHYSVVHDGQLIVDQTWDAVSGSYLGVMDNQWTIQSSSMASSRIAGAYTVSCTSFGTEYVTEFTVQPFLAPTMTYTEITTDPGAILNNQTNLLTWKSGVLDPTYANAIWSNGGLFGFESWTPDFADPGMTATSAQLSGTWSPYDYSYFMIATSRSMPQMANQIFHLTSKPQDLGVTFNMEEQTLQWLDILPGDTPVPVGKYPPVPVPEPTTYGLLGAGALVGLTFMRRQQARRNAA